ncbi:MAG: hypothetical protein J5634_02305 [Bacilli bacterium]|nr:hypothetical protein [Bacilli bacterium]
MKDNKILLFVIGLLLGAVISTGAFYIYSKSNSCDCSNNNTNQTNTNGQPPEMPSGQNNNGQPPAMPGENNQTSSNQTNS